MKIYAIFAGSVIATTKVSRSLKWSSQVTVQVSRHARSQSLFDEILGNDVVSERSIYGISTAKLHGILQFYLMVAGQDHRLTDKMLSYGCWCQIRNHGASGIVPGHGQPVDELDELCRDWHQCRSCTELDSTTGSCDSSSFAYEVGLDPSTNRIACDSYNSDQCAVNICKCDETLAHELSLRIGDRVTSTVTNADGSGFDHVNQCRSSVAGGGGNNKGGNNIGSTTQCCGEYPNRFTYSSKGGTTQCCWNKTYDRNRHECCVGSFLTSIGECMITTSTSSSTTTSGPTTTSQRTTTTQ